MCLSQSPLAVAAHFSSLRFIVTMLPHLGVTLVLRLESRVHGHFHGSGSRSCLVFMVGLVLVNLNVLQMLALTFYLPLMQFADFWSVLSEVFAF